jgi:hypothetical protein
MSNLAPVFAHECYHIFEGNPGATIQEEFTAYSAQYFVETSLKGSSSYGWLFQQEGALGSDKFLGKIQSSLISMSSGNAGDVYSVMPFRQNEMTQAALARQGLVAAQYMNPGTGATIVSYLAAGMLYVKGISWK